MKINLSTKQEKLNFIIKELKRLQGLEFINKEEVDAMNYACLILRNYIKKIDKELPMTKKDKFINNCNVSENCNNCYRLIVCKEGN